MNNADIKVLLVDDDNMIRECVAAYLEDEGFSVYGAADAEDALALVVAIRPAVCISDMRMRGMNGDEFIIKAHTISPETSYMLHTGTLYYLSDELRAIGMTADDILLKPIHDLSKLVDKITYCAAAARQL